MTVKDLFLSCDRQILKNYFMELEEVSVTEEMAEKIFSTINETEPVLSDDNIILGTKFVNTTDGLSDRIDVSMYKISEIMKNFRYCTIADKNRITLEEYAELTDFFSEIERCFIDGEAWGVVLGFLVDENNSEQLGKEQFMAEIICAMTLYGCVENTSGKNVKSIAPVAEKQQEKTISIDNMAAMLFGEGFSLTDNTEDMISSENAANMYSSYNAIRAFYEKQKNI